MHLPHQQLQLYLGTCQKGKFSDTTPGPVNQQFWAGEGPSNLSAHSNLRTPSLHYCPFAAHTPSPG